MRGAAAAIAVAALAGCGAEEHDPSSPAAAADELVVECDGSTTSLPSPRASAGPRGLTIVVRNTAGRSLGVSAEVEGGSGVGFGVEPGEMRGVYDLAPGSLRIACFDERRDDPSEVPRVTARIEADADSWRNDRLRCATGGRSVLHLDYASDAKGDHDPERAAATALGRDVRKSDELEQVGYLGRSDDRTYALVRDGRAVVLVAMHRLHEGWLVSRIERCDD